MRVGALDKSVIQWKDVVLSGFDQEKVLKFFQFVGVLCRKIVSFAEVIIQVVQLPRILGEIIAANILPRQASVPDSSDPTIVIERPVSEHLEILRLALLLGVRVIETVHHTDTFDGFLLDAVDFSGLWNAGGFQDGWRDVNRVMELCANATLVLDASWPGHHDRVACPTKMRCHLFAPLEGRVHRPGPANRKVVVSGWASYVVNVCKQEGRILLHATKANELVEHSFEPTFDGSAVVADFPDYECIVGLARLVECVQHAPNLVVSLRSITGESFHQAFRDFFLVDSQRIPRRNLLRPRRQFRVP